MFKSSKNNFVSFIIFLKNKNKSFNFHFSIFTINIIFLVFLFSTVLLITGIYLTYNKNFNETAFNQLKKDNHAYQKELKILNNKLVIVKSQMNHLIEKEEALESILGKIKIPSKKKTLN